MPRQTEVSVILSVAEKLDRASVWIAGLEDCPEAISDLNGLGPKLRAALSSRIDDPSAANQPRAAPKGKS